MDWRVVVIPWNTKYRASCGHSGRSTLIFVLSELIGLYPYRENNFRLLARSIHGQVESTHRSSQVITPSHTSLSKPVSAHRAANANANAISIRYNPADPSILSSLRPPLAVIESDIRKLEALAANEGELVRSGGVVVIQGSHCTQRD
jgi:hypothetical protein